jgi:hypothetical protein
MMISSGLVLFLMILGVLSFNSGVSGRGSAISMAYLSVFTFAVIALQVGVVTDLGFLGLIS